MRQGLACWWKWSEKQSQLSCCTTYVEGTTYSHSLKRLERLEPIISPTLTITPRQFIARDVSPNPNYIPHFASLRHDDSFHLQFQAYNSTITLYLHPNTELFHPDASTVVADEHGNEVTSSLQHEDYRIYKGAVLDDLDTMEEQGWARIIIRHDIRWVRVGLLRLGYCTLIVFLPLTILLVALSSRMA
jgi:hypothetical protein